MSNLDEFIYTTVALQNTEIKIKTYVDTKNVTK